MSVKRIKIASLKKADFNPKSRTQEIGPLASSIERVGMLNPILVTKGNEVIDGHRRIAAYEKLGRTEIECIIACGNLAEMFAEVNGQSKAINGHQQLQIYLKNPEAVGARARATMAECEGIVGRAIMQRMAKEGYSMGTWFVAKKLARLADREDPEILVKLVKWMMHYGCQGDVRKALQTGTAPGVVIAAALKNKQIRVKYAE